MKKILTYFLFLVIGFNIIGCNVNFSLFKNNKNEIIEEYKENINKAQEINNDNNDNKIGQKEEKKVVVIDPGHGTNSNLEKEKQSPDSDEMKIKDGGGADGIATNTAEYVINMKVAKKLKLLLEENNITVIMTKTDDIDSPGNIERAEIGNKNNADLVLRIHCDSSEDTSISGTSILVPAKIGYAVNIADISTNYGEIILNSLVTICNSKNRGVVERSDMTGFNWSSVPVVLIEMGFLSNPDEDIILNDDSYQNKLAQGLCEGVKKALEVS